MGPGAATFEIDRNVLQLEMARRFSLQKAGVALDCVGAWARDSGMCGPLGIERKLLEMECLS